MMSTFCVKSVIPFALCCALIAAIGGNRARAQEPAHAPTAAAKAHEAAEEPGEGKGVPLNFKEDLALWSLVVFLIFVGLLGRFAWKPLIAALDKRESRIRDDIAAAESARVKAEEMLAEHAKALAKVQDEVRAILAEGRRDAERAKQEIVGEAHKQAEAAKQGALHEIGRARDAALKDLFDTMASQVAQATEHVLGRSVTGADQDRLINEALAQFPRG